jgi:chemotaxis-related protein WspD
MTDDCWNVIGVHGDQSCPELLAHVHCRSCPVYGRAGPRLLERVAPAGYRDEWTAILAEPKQAATARGRSVLVFRVAGEWLALDIACCVEIAAVPRLHAVPHRVTGNLAGLVNVRGVLQPCIALRTLLSIDAAASTSEGRRLVVVARSGAAPWAFVADEVLGVLRYEDTDASEVPSTLERGVQPLTRRTFRVDERVIGDLDPERLFDAFDRCVE